MDKNRSDLFDVRGQVQAKSGKDRCIPAPVNGEANAVRTYGGNRRMDFLPAAPLRRISWKPPSFQTEKLHWAIR